MPDEIRFPGAKHVRAGRIVRTKYQSDHDVIALLVKRGADPTNWSKLTVNPPEPLRSGEVAIKNWSENEGVYEALLLAGIITPAHRVIASGYVEIPIVYLRVDIPIEHS